MCSVHARAFPARHSIERLVGEVVRDVDPHRHEHLGELGCAVAVVRDAFHVAHHRGVVVLDIELGRERNAGVAMPSSRCGLPV